MKTKSMGSRASESPFLRAGREAYEKELVKQLRKNQKGGIPERKRPSIDPPAALDPNELPPSPMYAKRALRSIPAPTYAAAGHPTAVISSSLDRSKDKSLYDDASARVDVGVYNFPTFKRSSSKGGNNNDLPYTWEDVVKEAERRKSRQDESQSFTGSSNSGSNHASPLNQKQVSRDVDQITKQKQNQQHQQQDYCSDLSLFENIRSKRIPQASSATNSPTSPLVSPNRRYQPKSHSVTRTILSVSNIVGEGGIESHRQVPSALTLPFQSNKPRLPSLPLVKSFNADKESPDQPAGLFLKKAKNGAVVVHSLSSTSIFRSGNATGKGLMLGQEVLSVNEKRVNDPKMAASLICQAKGRLRLRVSTVGRQRGFLYCQVKRRLGRTSKDDPHQKEHGVRFATTNTGGIRRGGTDGLVRVTHVDQTGLFASRNPLNRLRIGSIVLTVNGTPVRNDRSALEKIMETEHLIEVLHCDERVWREEWVSVSLAKILTDNGSMEKSKSGFDGISEESACTILTRDANTKRHEQYKLLEQYWGLSWAIGYNEVTLTKAGTSDVAFRLIFNDDVGTCKCEIVDGKKMPSTDEFDISSLVKSVNNAQKEMMTLLQQMLKRANLESITVGKRGLSKRTVSPTLHVEDRLKKVERVKSFEGIEEFVDNEQPISSSNMKVTSYKRRSTSGLPGRDINEQILVEDFEMLFLNETETRGNKLRDFSARQHIMEEAHFAYGKRRGDSNINETNPSMFSENVLEELVNNFEHSDSDSSSSSETNTTNSLGASEEPPPSPRDRARLLNKSAKSSSDTSVDDENAYITGVWRDVSSKYEISDTILGTGGFGEVKDCNDKNTGKLYVVKTILKPLPGDTVKINLIRNEILLLHEAKHPNIVELQDLFEDDKYVSIVMERCAGGDLFDRVVADNPRRFRSIDEGLKHEATTANAMRSIIQVVKYLHAKHIVHRDIKPEHFLLTETQKIKLIDFGLARKHDPESEPMTTFTGSPCFVAPEVIMRSYDHKCDNWSTGVTAFFLLTGMLPFDGHNDEETFQIISMGHFIFPHSSIFLSSDAKDFVANLLVSDPKRRMTASEALSHPFLRKSAHC